MFSIFNNILLNNSLLLLGLLVVLTKFRKKFLHFKSSVVCQRFINSFYDAEPHIFKAFGGYKQTVDISG